MKRALIAGVVLCLSSCGASQTQSGPNGTAGVGVNGDIGGGSGVAAIVAPDGKGFLKPSATELVSFVKTDGNTLYVGYSPGKVVVYDVDSRSASEKKIAEQSDVAGVSPDGKFFIVDSTPPAVVDSEGDLILQMNTVEAFGAGVFTPDGSTMMVSNQSGKVRIWGQAHSFRPQGNEEKLEDYLNRQAPDFDVSFEGSRGPMATSASGVLYIGDHEGVINGWDPASPSSAQRVMKLGAPLRSIAVTPSHVLATSTQGKLKVGSVDSANYLGWSKDAKGDYVMSTGFAEGRFASLQGNILAVRNIEDGKDVWRVELPGSTACGLTMPTNANWVAACVDNAIYIYDFSMGTPNSMTFRNGSVVWATADGEKVTM